MEEWLCGGGSGLPAASFFLLLKQVLLCGSVAGLCRQSQFFQFFSFLTLLQCGGVAGALKFDSDTNMVKGSVKA